MYIRTTYGPVWVSESAPYYRNWQGKMAYRYLLNRAKDGQPSTTDAG
jgi:hypothetical protein